MRTVDDFYKIVANLGLHELAVINRCQYAEDQFEKALVACEQLRDEGIVQIGTMHRESYTGKSRVMLLQITKMRR